VPPRRVYHGVTVPKMCQCVTSLSDSDSESARESQLQVSLRLLVTVESLAPSHGQPELEPESQESMCVVVCIEFKLVIMIITGPG
jgi:hypothetical protein